MASQQPLVLTPRSGDILGGLNRNRTGLPSVTVRNTYRYTMRPIFGVGDRNRTCIKRICNPEPNRSAAHPHKVVGCTGIEPVVPEAADLQSAESPLILPARIVKHTLWNMLYYTLIFLPTKGISS